MKKLLLASNGSFLTDYGYPILGIPKAKIRIAWITTASKKARNISYIKRHRHAMRKHGYRFEEIDIEDNSLDQLRRKLQDKNVMHVEGGPAFYLLKAIKETGFDKFIKTWVKEGKIYAGTSAGAYIACPRLEISLLHNKKTFGLKDFTALNLVPFLLKAHYTDDGILPRSLLISSNLIRTFNLSLHMLSSKLLVQELLFIFSGIFGTIRAVSLRNGTRPTALSGNDRRKS